MGWGFRLGRGGTLSARHNVLAVGSVAFCRRGGVYVVSIYFN